MLLELLKKTAWLMPEHSPYGLFHLGVMGIGITLAIISAYLGRNLSARRRDVLLFALGLLLALSECYKQLFLTFVMYRGSYSWWHLPFQLCSILMYLCLLILWLHGSLHQTVLEFLGSYTLIGALGAFIQPDGMFYRYWTLTLHSFIWHILLVFIGFFVGFSALPRQKIQPFLRAVLLYLLLAAMALILNLTLAERAGGNINMFYLGPKPSGQFFFSFVYQHLGWKVNAVVYCTVSTATALLVRTFFSRLTANSNTTQD